MDVVSPLMWGGVRGVLRAEYIGFRPPGPFILPRTCCTCIIDSLRNVYSRIQEHPVTRNFSVGFYPIVDTF